MLTLVGFDTLFVKKFKFLSKILQKCPKRVPKNKNAPFFDEKCLFKFSNVHLVGIHVQKTLHLRETGGKLEFPPGSPRRFQILVGIGLKISAVSNNLSDYLSWKTYFFLCLFGK